MIAKQKIPKIKNYNKKLNIKIETPICLNLPKKLKDILKIIFNIVILMLIYQTQMNNKKEIDKKFNIKI